MSESRRTATAEFQRAAVPLVTQKGYSVAEAARSRGLTEKILRQWKRSLPEHAEQAFPGHGDRPPAEDELRRLRAEVLRLRAGRDLLKKAAAYFASPPS